METRTCNKKEELLEVDVPLYYSVAPTLTDTEVASVQHALSITPIVGVIVVDAHDGQLALKFSTYILHVSSIESAHELAREHATKSQNPLIVISGEHKLAAHYSDGRTEAIHIPDNYIDAPTFLGI